MTVGYLVYRKWMVRAHTLNGFHSIESLLLLLFNLLFMLCPQTTWVSKQCWAFTAFSGIDIIEIQTQHYRYMYGRILSHNLKFLNTSNIVMGRGGERGGRGWREIDKWCLRCRKAVSETVAMCLYMSDSIQIQEGSGTMVLLIQSTNWISTNTFHVIMICSRSLPINPICVYCCLLYILMCYFRFIIFFLCGYLPRLPSVFPVFSLLHLPNITQMY